MFRAALIAALAVMALSCAAPGAAQPAPAAAETGDAARGLAYAEQVCAACHAVGAGAMRSPDARARPFDAIANTPGLTRTALNAWLNSSHTNMPNLIVAPDEADDLYAYLATLKRQP